MASSAAWRIASASGFGASSRIIAMASSAFYQPVNVCRSSVGQSPESMKLGLRHAVFVGLDILQGAQEVTQGCRSFHSGVLGGR
jgi:hypothetical protein